MSLLHPLDNEASEFYSRVLSLNKHCLENSRRTSRLIRAYSLNMLMGLVFASLTYRFVKLDTM
jgi:hypothetical protein